MFHKLRIFYLIKKIKKLLCNLVENGESIHLSFKHIVEHAFFFVFFFKKITSIIFNVIQIINTVISPKSNYRTKIKTNICNRLNPSKF